MEIVERDFSAHFTAVLVEILLQAISMSFSLRVSSVSIFRRKTSTLSFLKHSLGGTRNMVNFGVTLMDKHCTENFTRRIS